MKAYKTPLTSYKHHPQPLELLSQNKHFANFGVVYEDYARYQPPVIDICVSALLGFTAGSAMGNAVPLGGCLTIFIINILATAYHFGNTLYYRCINPRFLQGFTIAGTFLTFVGVILAFAQYLVKTFDYKSAYAALGLAQGGLGLATAIMGFLGFLNFLYQLFDAYYLRTTEANLQATGISKPENLDLINIEEELRKLEEEQEMKNHQELLQNNNNNNKNSSPILNDFDDDEVAEANNNNMNRERNNSISDDIRDMLSNNKDNKNDGGVLVDVRNIMDDLDQDDSKVNHHYDFDDDPADVSTTSVDDLMKKRMTVSKNEELVMRQQELSKMLDSNKKKGKGNKKNNSQEDDESWSGRGESVANTELSV